MPVADPGPLWRLAMYFCVHNCTSPSNDYAAVACSSNQAQLHTHVSVLYWSPDVWLGLELLLDIQIGLPTWPEVGMAIQNFSDWTPLSKFLNPPLNAPHIYSVSCTVTIKDSPKRSLITLVPVLYLTIAHKVSGVRWSRYHLLIFHLVILQVALILPAGTYLGLHLNNIWAPPTVLILWMFSMIAILWGMRHLHSWLEGERYGMKIY